MCSPMLMKHALTVTRSVAKQLGGFGMYLDADPRALDFYQKLGFVLLEGDRTPEPSPMFLALSAIPASNLSHNAVLDQAGI